MKHRNRYGIPTLFEEVFTEITDEIEDAFSSISIKDFFGTDCRVALKGKTTEKDDSYVTTLEVPGLSDDAIDVQHKDGHLVVHAEWKEDQGSLRAGKYCYNVYIPDVDAEKIEADLRKGVLTIISPKKESSGGSTIKIKVG